MFENLEKFKQTVEAEIVALVEANKRLTELNNELMNRVASLEKSVYRESDSFYE